MDSHHFRYVLGYSFAVTPQLRFVMVRTTSSDIPSNVYMLTKDVRLILCRHAARIPKKQN